MLLAPLSDRIREMLDRPGIYVFKSAEGRALYVGKAKSLKKRVVHYLQPAGEPRLAACSPRPLTSSSSSSCLGGGRETGQRSKLPVASLGSRSVARAEFLVQQVVPKCTRWFFSRSWWPGKGPN